MRFGLDGDRVIVINAMLAGRYRWRARALYASVCDSTITSDQRAAALAELKRKLQVLLQGYRKRRRSEEAGRVDDFLGAIDFWWNRRTADPRADLQAPPFPELVDLTDLPPPP